MTHSPFLCIGFVLFFEIAQSLPLKRSTFIPFPPLHCPTHCLEWCFAYTDVRRYYTLYKPLYFSYRTINSSSSPFHVHSPLKPQIGFAFYSPLSSFLTLFTWNFVTLLYIYSSPAQSIHSSLLPVCSTLLSSPSNSHKPKLFNNSKCLEHYQGQPTLF